MSEEFRNEPFTDFTKAENALAMSAALEKVKGELGREYPIVIGGERIVTAEKFESINPGRLGEVVGRFQHGREEHARQAVGAAYEAFKSWSRTPPQVRAD